MSLYPATIFLSASLLFLVQPLIATQILPWFGGAVAVWAICLVFFRSALLAGYAYADWTTPHLTPRRQAWVHLALLDAEPIRSVAQPIEIGDGFRIWTGDFYNLLRALK